MCKKQVNSEETETNNRKFYLSHYVLCYRINKRFRKVLWYMDFCNQAPC